ncbi:unnamed protein product (macronuclear) [Paramecium tetraurelia]|uniref:Uncharacterized protein n=1 Tax=Paramecium tetraurelia TaxID=5888 RepID=A0DNB4_PARTE|nr:uncharacterized protein GSPATT00039689001 [Paramecium tetraurelia]CAK84531.1 unnamed protein product [Paramecium tetraurelia]|eukprot:XP_001451928.1 hypothetical protein (macronuclear) [Paramecium tetraurelia strain d4-2]
MLIIYYFVLKISNVDGVFKDGNNYTIISNPFSNVYTLELFNQDEFHLNGGIFAMRQFDSQILQALLFVAIVVMSIDEMLG